MVFARNPLEVIRCRRGATATEYIVMLILTALFVLGIIRVFGDTIKDKYERANSELTGTLAEDDPGPGIGGVDDGSGAGGLGASGSASASGGKGGKGGKSGKGSAGAGSGAGGSGGSGGGSDGSSDGREGSGGAAVSGGSGGGAGLGGCGGDATFNPAILVAALLMIGLLLYVMFKGKDG